MTTQPRPAPRRRPRTTRTRVHGVSVHLEPGEGSATRRPPTEAEIRQAIADGLEHTFAGHGFSIDDNPAYEVLKVILNSDMARAQTGWDPNFGGADGHPGTLWADLRPSEVDELKDPIDAAVVASEQAYIERLIEEIVPLVVRFAEAHPDAPRGAWRAEDAAALLD